ncbi:MAG: NAD(P)H-dependent oxidoreductase [Opitutales bacterium]
MSITHLANNIYMKLLVISCSLNPQSKSRILGRSAFETLKAQSHSVEWMDLQDYEIPHCDGGDAYGHPHVEILQKKLAEADGVLIACPVYNYSISSTAKNIIELGSSAWTGKVIGIAVASGGSLSYLAPLSLANSLMTDFRCVIIPRFVFAPGEAVTDDGSIADKGIIDRLDDLTKDLASYTQALRGITEKH